MSFINMLAVVLLLMPLSTSLLPPAGAAGTEPVTSSCNNGSYYAANSTYQSNVRSVLASLASNASRPLFPVGFATAVVGASPDTVWGLGLCRGDTNRSDCVSCLAMAPDVAFGRCQGVKDVTIFYDRCILRYSPMDFLTKPDNGQVQEKGISPVNVTSDAGWYSALVANLTGALSDWAAFNTTSRYAVGVMSSDMGFPATDQSVVHVVYGLVQCTPDQAPRACRMCLQSLIDDMPALFHAAVGGRFFAVWCNLRFETHEFYDGTPMLNLAAPRFMTPPPPAAANRTRGGGNNAATVVAIILGVVLAVLVSTLIILLRRKAQVKQHAEDDEGYDSLLFDLTTLRRATGNFAEENKLGHGGFGAVYKGFLPDGRQIAVKRLDKASSQGLKQLKNELLLVAKLRHNNLAKLLGVCLKEQERLLVYEYMPNRSLDTFLFVPEKRLSLGWETRYRIIYGTARGLLYLHEDSQIKIVHRDLKASNILLDADMNPKISDFGLARLFNSDKTSTVTSQVVGTLGYMAPEYAVMGRLSVKLDVYSFGVLVLEILTGRRNTDSCSETEADDESSTLLSYVWDHWSKGTALETMDPSLESEAAPESEVLKCIHLGLLCVQENPADRPTTLDILVMLHGQTSSSFAAPSKPAFAFVHGERTSSSGEGLNGVASGGSGDQGGAPAASAFSVIEISVSEFQPR